MYTTAIVLSTVTENAGAESLTEGPFGLEWDGVLACKCQRRKQH